MQTSFFSPGFTARSAVPRVIAVVLVAIALVSVSGGVAMAVVGGKTVPITAAPWTVVVWEPTYPGQPRYAACTGVIIDPLHILTAGHCVMVGNSAKPMPASDFGIEAGVSDFKHPFKSDHPQLRKISAVRAMPGYIAASKITSSNVSYATAHDVALLTLSRPLDLHGDDARAAHLPSSKTPQPWRETRLVIAGFGNEKPKAGVAYQNGTLNEVAKAAVLNSCSTSQVLCVSAAPAAACYGDSGSGLVEPGRRPTAVGMLSEGTPHCGSGTDYDVALTAPAVLRFIRAST